MATRETFSELLKKGWSLHRRLPEIKSMVFCNADGELELWTNNDSLTGFGIIFEGRDYEFVTSDIERITHLINKSLAEYQEQQLPYVFDLLWDIKTKDQLMEYYKQLKENISEIEQVAKENNIPLIRSN